MSDIYTPEDIEAETRHEMVCPRCFEQGLAPYPAFARDYDDPRQQLIHGTKCPQCDERVPPETVRTMLKPKQFGIGSLSFDLSWLRGSVSRSALKYAAGFFAAIFVFVVIPTVGMAAIDGGGAGFQDGGDSPYDGTQVVSTEGGWNVVDLGDQVGGGDGYIIANETAILCHDGVRELPENPADIASVCTYESPEVGGDRLEAYLSGTEWQFNETELNISDGGERLSTINYLHGTIVDEDENPYSGGTIVFADDGRTIEADSNGEYELEEHLAAGTYEIYAYTDSASTVPFEIEVDENGRVSVAGNPDSALYVSDDDGTLAQNRLNFIATSQYDIGASGGVEVDVE
jgi:hypothetical protein